MERHEPIICKVFGKTFSAQFEKNKDNLFCSAKVNNI